MASGYDALVGSASLTKASTQRIARQPAGTSIGPATVPVICWTHGARFCAKKPPIFPIELIAAMLAAARAPVNILDGNNQKQGLSTAIQGPPIASATKRRAGFSTNTPVAKQSVPRHVIPATVDSTDL